MSGQDNSPILTTRQWHPVSDNQSLRSVGERGPATLENLCTFIFTKLVARCPQLVAVSVERQASGDKCVLRKERKADATTSSPSVGAAARSALPA